jgi:integrase/recombinase XerC
MTNRKARGARDSELRPYRDLRAELVAAFASQGLSEQSSRTLLELALRFVVYVDRACPDGALAETDPAVVASFLTAPLSATGDRPSVATSHLRRSAVRLLFRTLRQLGVADADPTLDLLLPPRSSLACRPLTDDEVAVCRSFSLQTLSATRQPAAWALAEASARTSEIHAITARDVDLDARRVWIPGSIKTAARFGELTDWGVLQIDRRMRSLKAHKTAPAALVYDGAGSAESRQVSSCAAIAETLRRSGLTSETDVRPLSVAAWAGRHALERSGRIEDAARTLGVRSLDRAARLIGWDWQDTTGDSP